MKNIYLYGASDDLAELDSDFGLREETSPEFGFKINDMVFEFEFDGDWGVHLKEGEVPAGWKVYGIDGNTASKFRRLKNAGVAIHIQAPEDAEINLYTMQELREESYEWTKA